MPKPLKKAIAYLRVSTNQQGETGRGFELQEARIREFARHEGYEIAEIFRDAQSGMGEDSFKNRFGANEALRMSKTEGWPIIVDGLDRFVRNTKGLEEVVAAGKLTIISAKGGKGASKAVLMGEAARAQREGELISTSTKRALQELKNRGVRLGNPTNLPEAQRKGAVANKALGEARAHHLAPVIQELRQGDKKTAQEIAEGLNQKGFQTPRGGPWKDTNVRRLLKRVDEILIAQKVAAEAERYKDNPLWNSF